MNLSRAMIVIRKELTDGFRDRRSIYSIAIGAMIGPFLIAFMLNRIANQQRGAQDIRGPVIGRNYAPVLVNWLEQQAGVEITTGPSDPENRARDPRLECVLAIPED